MGEAKKPNSLFYKLLKNKGIKDVDKQEHFIWCLDWVMIQK